MGRALFPASVFLGFLLFILSQDRAAAAGPTMFLTAQSFPAGNENRSLVMADFNGDGKPDVAVAADCVSDSKVSVLLNRGNGTFRAAVDYPVGRCPNSIAVADFNGDGKLDLVTANLSSDDNVSVLLGNGDGTFRTAVNYAAGSGPVSVAVGDFNGDGKLDLAVADANSKSVTVLLGNGDGTFRAPARNFSVPETPTAVVVADFNGDGKPDVAIASSSGPSFQGISILLGNGDGTFQSAITRQLPVVGSPFTAIAAGDLNGDGKPDLVTANAGTGIGGGNVSVLLGNGDGTFQRPTDYTTVQGPQAVALGDFNHDGKLDVVVASYGTDDVSVLLGKGDGTLRPAVNFTVGSDEPFSVGVGDLNGDGKLDIVTGNLPGTVSVLFGNGSALLQAPTKYVPAIPDTGVASFAIGDFNRDGKPDLAVANSRFFIGKVTVFLGNANGTFRAFRTYSVGEAARFVAVGDFNGDGKLDLVTADDAGNKVSVQLGNGDGTLQPAVQYSVGSLPQSIGVGDFNGDGKLDLAVANFTSNNVSVLLGNGNGTFQTAVNYSVGTNPQSVAVGDFNRDGKLDLVVANSGETDVSVLLGKGDGTFQAAATYSTGAYFPQGVAVGDFRGEGKLDLAVSLFSNTSLTPVVGVFLGNGDGTFQPAVSYSVGGCYPGPVVVADFNNDGKLDLAAGAPCGDGLGLSVLLGNGDGTFQPAVSYNSGPTFGNTIAAEDFNGDKAPDIAAVSADGVAVLLNTRGTRAHARSSKNPSSFGESVTFAVCVQPTVTGSVRVAGLITGTVTFRDGNTTLGTVPLDSSGHANFTTSGLSRGSHTITATYSGDSNYNPVTSPPLIQIVQ